MKRCILTVSLTLAALGGPAFAQSFDETVAYIQDRCVGSSVSYSDHATVSAVQFSAEQSGALRYVHRTINLDGSNPYTHTYSVPLSDIETIEADSLNNVRITINAADAIFTTRTSSRGSAGPFQTSQTTMHCPNRDRIIRALRHLVSLADDDPFAN